MKKRIIFILFLTLGLTRLQAKDKATKIQTDTSKIGYVDLGYILGLLPEMKIVNSELASFDKQFQKQIDASVQEFTQKKAAYDRGHETMTEAVKKKKKSELQQLIENIQRLSEQEYPQKLSEKRRDLFLPINEKIISVIRQVAIENGYTCIFNKSEQLIYANDTYNITDAVLRKLGIDPVVAKNKNNS